MGRRARRPPRRVGRACCAPRRRPSRRNLRGYAPRAKCVRRREIAFRRRAAARAARGSATHARAPPTSAQPARDRFLEAVRQSLSGARWRRYARGARAETVLCLFCSSQPTRAAPPTRRPEAAMMKEPSGRTPTQRSCAAQPSRAICGPAHLPYKRKRACSRKPAPPSVVRAGAQNRKNPANRSPRPRAISRDPEKRPHGAHPWTEVVASPFPRRVTTGQSRDEISRKGTEHDESDWGRWWVSANRARGRASVEK